MNAKSLALISGKGGCGKTTIAICMASMLADCGQKVLLVDCDLSTNGATYFFEDRINEIEDKIFSFMDTIGLVSGITELGNQNAIKRLQSNDAWYLSVSNNFSFVPSVLPNDLRRNDLDAYYTKVTRDAYSNIYNYFKEQFDIVIFDCQAGYSLALECVLPVSDYTLLVMEADAISSAAVRNLYIKIEPLIRNKKVYQVFSKVTKEEKAVYGQVLLGTFYTNIEAVVFDWSVRKAFAVANMPDLKYTNSEFGMQIYNICERIFTSKDMKSILRRYKDIFEFNRLEAVIEDYRMNQKSNELLARSVSLLGVVISVVLILIILYRKNFLNVEMIYAGFLVLYVCGFITLLVTVKGRGMIKKRREYLESKEAMRTLLENNPELRNYGKKERKGYDSGSIKI